MSLKSGPRIGAVTDIRVSRSIVVTVETLKDGGSLLRRDCYEVSDDMGDATISVSTDGGEKDVFILREDAVEAVGRALMEIAADSRAWRGSE